MTLLQYGEELYGITPPGNADSADSDAGDIEASIQRELDGIKSSGKKTTGESPPPVFAPVRFSIDCVFFMKTRPPVEP